MFTSKKERLSYQRPNYILIESKHGPTKTAVHDKNSVAIGMANSGVIAVVVLSSVMFFASFGAGIVPLVMSLNHERMSVLSSLGIGLLVGTSLGVVLPEGIEMLYSSMELGSSVTHHQPLRRQGHIDPGNQQQSRNHISTHFAIALALVLGYLVMHLLTFLPPLVRPRNPQTPIPLAPVPSSPRLERISSNPPTSETSTGLSNTTIGLCVHALADGIALGSSAVSNNVALEGIVFFAIMLHKVTHRSTILIFRHQHHSRSQQYSFKNYTLVIQQEDNYYCSPCRLHYQA